MLLFFALFLLPVPSYIPCIFYPSSLIFYIPPSVNSPILSRPPSVPPSFLPSLVPFFLPFLPLILPPSYTSFLLFSISLLLLYPFSLNTLSLPFNHLDSLHLYSHPYFLVFSVHVLCVLYVYTMCMYCVFAETT